MLKLYDLNGVNSLHHPPFNMCHVYHFPLLRLLTMMSQDALDPNIAEALSVVIETTFIIVASYLENIFVEVIIKSFFPA